MITSLGYSQKGLALKNKIRILQVGAENFGHGGRSVIAYNLVKYLPYKIFQVDFLALKPEETNQYVRHINEHGQVLFVSSTLKNVILRRLCNDLSIIKVLRAGKYDVIHIHADNAYEAIRSVIFSKIAGINGVIVHAHVDNVHYSWMKTKVITILQKLLPLFGVKKIACTNSAGKFMFGNMNKLMILNDGIDVAKFKFNDQVRKKVRDVNRWHKRIVIGTVARLSREKNLSFLIRVFSQLTQIPNAVLVIIGEGKERKKLESLVVQLKIKDRVTFMGNRDDVSQLLQGFDIFILPSIYEGFGISAIEAQAAGLITFVSDDVPEETRMVSSIYHRLKLSRGPKYWASKVKTVMSEGSYLKRKDTSSIIRNKGFDIRNSSKQLQDIYYSLRKED